MTMFDDTREHRIPPPSVDRPPLKANVFASMQQANTQLAPLFPYFDDGAIVPCGALMRGGPDRAFTAFGDDEADFGNFFHFNTQDEVALIWVSDGGLRGSGLLRCLANQHGVKAHLRDPADPDSFSINVITQRQTAGVDQHEAVSFRCQQCRTELLRHEYSAEPGGASPEQPVPTLPAIVGSYQAAATYNAHGRTCPTCGHENPRFPVERWGWDQHAAQHRIANLARRALDQAATAAARGDEA